VIERRQEQLDARSPNQIKLVVKTKNIYIHARNYGSRSSPTILLVKFGSIKGFKKYLKIDVLMVQTYPLPSNW
jgi:hypothetical protein